jgi:diguanylate cyclase (GGDEF)-like protein/PAS domain S-box-containing protein
VSVSSLLEEASMGCDGGLHSGSSPPQTDKAKKRDSPRHSGAVQAAPEEALSASYRSVFDALDEAFCVIEMIRDDAGVPVDYRFVEINGAFEDHAGTPGLLGRTAREALPSIEPFWIETYGRVALSGEPIRFVHELQPLRRWFDVYAWPFGRPASQRVALHFTDITQRKLAEDELRYRSEQFHALVEQAPLGVYLVDADFRVIEVNPTARPVFGGIPDLIGRDYGEVLRIIWPKALADEVIQIARRTMLTGVSYHEPEMSGVRADRGNTEYYDWRLDRIRLPDGTNGLVCYFIDISRQVWARHALAVSENRYRTLFESIDEGFCIIELIFDEHERPIDFRYVEINPVFGRHTGFTDALGRTIRELAPEIEPFWIGAYAEVSRTGEPARFVDHVESIGRWFDVYAFRIGEPEERKVAVLFNDITERKRAEHALQESVALLRHHAHHDALTGLPNRLMFEEMLHAAVAATDRHGRPFAVLFLDLDGFKTVNDDLGHASGDVVLIEVARRLRRSLRATDFLGRIHGDEFVALLPETAELQEAGSVAQKLLHVVSVPIDVAGTTAIVQASIGVALYPQDGANPRALLRAADAAMYQAKLKGKNGVSYFLASRDGVGPEGQPS